MARGRHTEWVDTEGSEKPDDPGKHTVTGWSGSDRPAHGVRGRRPPGRFATAVGVVFVLIGLGVAAVSCLGSQGPSKSTPTSASLLTVPPATGTAPATMSSVSPAAPLP